MKGNDKTIEKLNFLLTDELTAISQYMVQAEMCENWGYKEMADVIEKRAINEIKHAEKHIARFFFLKGKPVASDLNKTHIGDDIEAFHKNDWESESGTIQAYNEAIKLGVEVGDNGRREMLEGVLKDEEAHIDWIEAQLDQIRQMGFQSYLSGQIS